MPDSVHFHDLSTGNPNSWFWDFGDGSTSINQNPTHHYVSPGTYTVTLIISDGLNYDTLTRTDLIKVDPPPLSAHFSTFPDYSAPFTVSFDNLILPPPDSCFWDYGDLQTSTTCDIPHSHTYPTVGNYWTCLTINQTGCITTFCDSIHADSSTCLADFDLYADTLPQHYIAVNRTSGTFPLNYFWEWGDGDVAFVPFPTHSYDNAGSYTICLSITDSDGCSDTYCNSYFLQKHNAIVEVTVIPPPQNTGITISSDSKTILSFPNPASNYLMIEFPPDLFSKADVKIFNSLGQLQFSSIIADPKTYLDISELTSGIYILEVRAAHKISRQKFIKE